jgi:ABC-2 type transport system permease protein
VLAFYWPHLVNGATNEERYVSVASILAFRILALSSAIYTTAIVSQEVEGRTIVYLLTRPVPRWRLLLTRFAASVIVVALLGFLSLELTSLAAYGGRSNPLLFNDMKAVAFGALAYGSLFLLVSLAVNRAMVYCLLFAFGWETSIPNLSGDLYHLSIYSYLQGIAQHPVTQASRIVEFIAGGAGGNSISALSAYLSLSIFAAATLLLSAWWFTHFEYVPREDAE